MSVRPSLRVTLIYLYIIAYVILFNNTPRDIASQVSPLSLVCFHFSFPILSMNVFISNLRILLLRPSFKTSIPLYPFFSFLFPLSQSGAQKYTSFYHFPNYF